MISAGMETMMARQAVGVPHAEEHHPEGGRGSAIQGRPGPRDLDGASGRHELCRHAALCPVSVTKGHALPVSVTKAHALPRAPPTRKSEALAASCHWVPYQRHQGPSSATCTASSQPFTGSVWLQSMDLDALHALQAEATAATGLAVWLCVLPIPGLCLSVQAMSWPRMQ